MDTAQLLSVSVTPVVLISACGLIAQALYSRLGAILARIRALHQEKTALLKHLEKRVSDDRRQMLELVDSQIAKVTIKAKVVQRSLYCLLAAVLVFLFCSLLAPATLLHPSLDWIALAMHVLGVLLSMAGIGWAIRELTMSLLPLEEETACLDLLTAQYQAKSDNEHKVRLAKSA